MSELRFHSGDPKRRARSAEIGARAGAGVAAVLVTSGTLVVAGLAGAPDLLSDLIRSADHLALRETALRGTEAFSSVSGRQARIASRLAADELFLARVATLTGLALPEGFPADPFASLSVAPSDVEGGVALLGRRLRVFELLRRRVAALPPMLRGIGSPLEIPSRSPVEPSSAVPVHVFGAYESPLTHRTEFFPGLAVASPAGSPVLATAAGAVHFAGPIPRSAEARWRRLGTVVVLAHGPSTFTVYGHLEKVVARKGQRVSRGDVVGLVGTSGFASTPRLHYELRRAGDGGAFLPVDPRLYILDVDWITAAEVRARPAAPKDLDLPPAFR